MLPPVPPPPYRPKPPPPRSRPVLPPQVRTAAPLASTTQVQRAVPAPRPVHRQQPATGMVTLLVFCVLYPAVGLALLAFVVLALIR